MNPLITTVLDLDRALGGNAGLLLGGGLGLFLKQEHLRGTAARTLLPNDRMPWARTTQDIDLFVRAEIIASQDGVARYRAALDELGFSVVPGSEWLKFRRDVDGSRVLLDVMVGPLGEHAAGVKLKNGRARPRGFPGRRGLHAFATREALGVERSPMLLELRGTGSDGAPAVCVVRIPRAFPYAVMKLGALRDRIGDQNKQEGRHHAMDLYRIVGMLTEEDEAVSAGIAREHADDPVLAEARHTIETLLAPADGLGRLRLLEYQRANPALVPAVDPDMLVAELRRLLGSSGQRG